MVKKVIVNLARNLESEKNIHEWQGVPVEEFLRKDETPQTASSLHKHSVYHINTIHNIRHMHHIGHNTRPCLVYLRTRTSRTITCQTIFHKSDFRDRSDDDQFSRSLVLRLIERLEEQPLQHLTPNELASLLVLIQTTLEVYCLLITYSNLYSSQVDPGTTTRSGR